MFEVGLVEKRPNSMAGLYGAQDAGREFAGTATYASIEALSGKPPSVSDEIQSMVGFNSIRKVNKTVQY